MLADEVQVSGVHIEGGTDLEFHYAPGGNGPARSLRLREGGIEETLWSCEMLEPIVIQGYFASYSYEEVELVLGAVKNGVVAALFRLSPGKQVLVPSDVEHRGYIPISYSQNDYILRMFKREGGNWVPRLAFYPQTFFGDLTDESVARIRLIDEDSLDLVYEGEWRIVGSDYSVIGGYYKLRGGGRSVVKRFRYSKEQDILYILDDTGSLKFVEGSLWWAGDSGFDSAGDRKTRSELFSSMIKERKERIEVMGIVSERITFFYEAPMGKEEILLEYEKYLESQETDRLRGDLAPSADQHTGIAEAETKGSERVLGKYTTALLVTFLGFIWLAISRLMKSRRGSGRRGG